MQEPPTPQHATAAYLRVAVDAGFRQTRRPGNAVPPAGAAPPIGRGTPPSPLWPMERSGRVGWGGADGVTVGRREPPVARQPSAFRLRGWRPQVPRLKADSAGRSTRISLQQDVDFNCCPLKWTQDCEVVPHPRAGAWSPGVCHAPALGGGRSHFWNLDVTVCELGVLKLEGSFARGRLFGTWRVTAPAPAVSIEQNVGAGEHPVLSFLLRPPPLPRSQRCACSPSCRCSGVSADTCKPRLGRLERG